MEDVQFIGIIIGAIGGHIIAAVLAGGSYTYIGGNLFEVTGEPSGCIQGCLVEIIAVGLDGVAGYLVAGVL